MILHLFKFFSRIHKAFSCVALFCALLSAGFLSAKYELKIEHDPKAVMLSFAKDGHASKLLVMNIDPKTGTFANRDYMHELLDIEGYGKTGVKIAFKDNKNECTAVLYHDDKNQRLDIKKFILDEDMELSTNGDVAFTKGVHCKKMLTISGKNICNNCTFEAKNIVLKNSKVKSTFTNNALIQASEYLTLKNLTFHNNGTVQATMGFFADQTAVINDYMLASNGAIDMRDGTLRNHGTIKTLSIIACSQPVVEQTGTLDASTIIINQPHVGFENKGIIAGSDLTKITALNIVNNGTITGAIKTNARGETLNKQCLLNAAAITNNGTMIGGQNFELQATKEILNYGVWITNKQFAVSAPVIGNFKATLKERNEDQGIHGPGSFTADCDNFTNALDAQFAIKGDVNLTARTKAYNAGLLHSDGNQQLAVADLEIETNHILEMNGNGTITCAKPNGKILNKGLLAINGNGAFNCSNYYNDGTTWTKGTMTFNVPGNLENRQKGRIESNGYLTIDATNFVNQVGFIFGHNGGRINTETFSNSAIITKIGSGRHDYWTHSGWGIWREDHCYYCTCYDTYSGSNPPIIAISNGPFDLNIRKNGINEAGIIAVEKDIDIVAPVFANNQRDYQTVTSRPCSRGGHPSENSLINHSKFHAAITSSAGGVRIKTSNVECKVKNQGEMCTTAGSFTNTGYIGAQQNIEFTAEGLAKFYNGLSQETNAIVIQENAYSRNIAIIPLEDPRNKYVYVKSNNPQAEYQFDRALVTQKPDQENDPRTLVYLNDGKPWEHVPRRFISPMLQAEGISQALAMMGRFILPGYETIFEQSLGMEHHGGMIGIVHGTPQAIGAATSLGGYEYEASAEATRDLSSSDTSELKALNTMYGGARTAQEFEKIIRILSDGKHISTMTQEHIDGLPYPFIYYARYQNTEYVIPVLHLPKTYQDKLWRMPGTIEAGGAFQIFKFDEVENTGQILGKQIIIKAQKVTNRKRTTSRIEGIHQSGGWFGSDKVIRYEVLTPEQHGGNMIAGVSIEIVAHDDLVNQGGTIMSVDVLMKSKDGSIINKHNPITKVIKWDTGFWGNAFGTQSSSLAMGFQPGVILAAGNLQMLSPTQKIINEASTIVAKHAKLQGYLGILSKTLADVHTASASTSHSWFAFKSEKSEAYSTGPAIMDFRDDVELVSEKGSFHGVGAQFKAKKAVFNTQNNIFEPVTVTLHHQLTEGGVKAFEVFGSRTNMQQTVAIPTVLQIDEALIKAAIDNTMEAVFMVGTDGGPAKFIHFVAGRDNVFKGAHQTTTVDTNSFSMGVSFFGSEAAKQLLNGRVKDAFIKLAEEEPLVRSLEALKNAQDWQDRTGESAHVAVEALRLLVDRVESAQAGQSFKNFMGQRYGITDAQGNFAPALRFRCSFTQSSSSIDQTVPSFVHVKDIIVDSGRNIDILDGTKIKADNVMLRGEALHMTSGTTVKTMMQTMLGYSATVAGKNLASVGIDFADGHAESTAHSNAEVEASNTLIVKVKDLMARGGVLLGDIVDLNAVNMCFESVQDITDQKMVSGGASLGLGYDMVPDVGGGFTRNAHDSILTAQRSKVRARTQLMVDATGKLKLVGANLEVEGDKPGSYVKTPLLEAYDLNDHSHTHQLAAQISTSMASSVKALADFNLQRQQYLAKQHSMISKNIDLQADKATGDKLVHNAAEQTEVIEDSHSHWRIVAPVIDSKKFEHAKK